MSSAWSSFENDRLIMESWRGHLSEETPLTQLDENESVEGTIQPVMQEVGKFLSKLWSDPEFREAGAKDAAAAAMKAKDEAVVFAGEISEGALKLIAKALILKLKFSRKPLTKRNMYTELLTVVKFLLKNGTLLARTALMKVSGGGSEAILAMANKFAKDESGDSAIDQGMEELFISVQNAIFKRLMALPAVQQALTATGQDPRRRLNPRHRRQMAQQAYDPDAKAPTTTQTIARAMAENIQREIPTERWQQLASIPKRVI